MTDLILSVVRDRQWNDLYCYANSIVRSGFTGRKVMFVENVSPETQKNLIEHGFELYEFRMNSRLHFQTWRYYPALDFLKRNMFRHVIWTDACDVAFQSDPVSYLEERTKGTDYLALAREAWRIKDQDINDVWIRRLSNDTEYNFVREYDVLCSGTIAGSGSAIIELFEKMVISFGDEMQGIDQGILNWVVRLRPFNGIVWIPDPECGFVATCGTFLAPSDRNKWTYEPPVFDRNTGLVMTPDGHKPFVIVHQYNRRYGICDPTGTWREILERRYV